MIAFEIDDVCGSMAKEIVVYNEFFRRDSMSMGIYRLPAGSVDPQKPHREDEVYVVLEGTGKIRVDDEDRSVAKGSIVFVEKGVDHQFHSIASDLIVLVVFAPAES